MTSKHNIVVGYDTSELAGRALEAAIAHAASLAPATVHVVRALALMPGVDEDQGAANAQLARLDYQAEALRETVERQTLPVGVTLVTHVNVGEPATILAEVARAADADFVFVGTHGRTGLARAFFGSIAERTVRLAPCSVVVVRHRAAHRAGVRAVRRGSPGQPRKDRVVPAALEARVAPPQRLAGRAAAPKALSAGHPWQRFPYL
jgi:nucleotide-binding universal stress UspA family protein